MPTETIKSKDENLNVIIRTVEVEQSRYEELVACETELKLLKNAIAVINSYDLSNIIKMFGIEKGKE